jgi:hypothetical protein
VRKFTLTASIIVAAVMQLLFSSCSDSKLPIDPPEDSVALPFPQYTFERRDSSFNSGCFLVSLFGTQKEADKHKCSIFILDASGATVWCKPNTEWSNFQIHEEGWYSYYSHGKYYTLDSRFQLTDSVWCVNGAVTDAHELIWEYETHHYILLGTRTDTLDASEMGRPKGSPWRGGKKCAVKYGVIQEVDEDNNLVWEWSSKGHFLSENMDRAFLLDSNKLDIPHFNSIDIDSAGNFLVSARYTHEVFYLNRQTDSIEWRLGGNLSDFTFLNDSLPFLGQHQPRWLPNGNILMYDNGYSYPANTHNSRSVEYKLDMAAKTATRVWSWSYPQDLVAESTGGTQRLPSGRTLVSFGKLVDRKPNVLFAVVNPDNSIAAECSFSDTLGTYRTYFSENNIFHPDMPSLVLYISEGEYWIGTADRSVVLWSNGIVGNGIRVYKPGIYQCFRKNADGSFSGSFVMPVTQAMLDGLMLQ